MCAPKCSSGARHLVPCDRVSPPSSRVCQPETAIMAWNANVANVKDRAASTLHRARAHQQSTKRTAGHALLCESHAAPPATARARRHTPVTRPPSSASGAARSTCRSTSASAVSSSIAPCTFTKDSKRFQGVSQQQETETGGEGGSPAAHAAPHLRLQSAAPR